MNLTETTQTLAVLGPVFGVVSTILGIAVWVLKSHIQSKNETIKELKEQQQTLKAQLMQEEAKSHQLKIDVTELQKAKSYFEGHTASLEEQLREAKTKRNEAVAKVNEYALRWQELQKKWKQVEQGAKQAEAKAAQLEDLLARSRAAAAAAEQRLKEVAAEQGQAVAKLEAVNKKLAAAKKQAKALEAQINAVAEQDGRVWMQPVQPDIPAFVPLSARRTPIISVLNLKGGVGKTTITANLGGFFGEAGKRVLLIDLDHQRSLSQMLLPATERERLFVQGRSIQHFFQSASRDSGALLSCAASVEGVENCRLVTNGDPPSEAPAGQSLDDLEMRLMSQWLLNASWQPDIRYFLRRALHGVPVTEQCDLVLLDCPPRLTTACVNALAASDFVLIPVQPDAVALRSVGHLLLRLKQLKAAGVLAELRVLGVVANMVAERAFKPKSIESGMLESSCTKAGVFWGQPVPHFRTMLSRMIQYVDASRNLEVGSKLRLAIDFPAVHREYEQLAKEIEGPIYAHLSPAGVPS